MTAPGTHTWLVATRPNGVTLDSPQLASVTLTSDSEPCALTAYTTGQPVRTIGRITWHPARGWHAAAFAGATRSDAITLLWRAHSMRRPYPAGPTGDLWRAFIPWGPGGYSAGVVRPLADYGDDLTQAVAIPDDARELDTLRTPSHTVPSAPAPGHAAAA